MNQGVAGGALILGGLGSAYFSTQFPGPQRQYAMVGGLLAAGVGVLLVYKAVKDGGGLVKAGAELVFGGDPESLEGETQSFPVTPSAPIALQPQLIGAAALRARFVAPLDGGSVRRSLFSGDYQLELEVTNLGASTWNGLLAFELEEDYLLNDDRQTVTRQVSIPAGSTRALRFQMPLAAMVFVRSPEITCTVRAGDYTLAKATYQVAT